MTVLETGVFLLYIGVLFGFFALIALASDYAAKKIEHSPELVEDFRRIWNQDEEPEELDDADWWDYRKAIEEGQS